MYGEDITYAKEDENYDYDEDNTSLKTGAWPKHISNDI